jgi:hypothetical protein
MVRKTRTSPIGAAFSNRHFHLNLMTLPEGVKLI